MFEALKLLFDSVARILPSLMQRRRDARLADIGADLMLLYTLMNETLLNAERIISSLEVFTERMGTHLDDGSDKHATTGPSWVIHLVAVQRENIAKLGYRVNSLATKWQMVDPGSFVDLGALFQGKMNALDYLLEQLGRNRLPLGPDKEIELSEIELGYPADFGDYEARARLAQKIAGEELNLSAQEWGAAEYHIVLDYLERRKPREELAKMRGSLASLHDALLENFELKDVLLHVEDKRLSPRYDGSSFWGARGDD